MKIANVTNLEDWQLIDWQTVEENVQKVRYRIFEARRLGRMKTVKNLQKLMLRSRSNWLLAIRRITQINKGRRTPGVDREIITTPEERVELFYWLESMTLNDWHPPPTRRVEIPKGGGKTRVLGIPTIRDRVIQAIVKNALEPEWEAIFEVSSYGFRPGRSAHDAIVSVWTTYAGPGGRQKDWILDADIKGAFDHISHDYLLDKLGYFPAKQLIEKWLKAGVMTDLELTPTSAGTPQGGIISPLLANIALDGMEASLGIVRSTAPTHSGILRITGPYKIVRYADDFVVQCYSREEAQQAQLKLQKWLAIAGLEMSQEKTRIINIWDGVDFLGFTLRKRRTNRNIRKFSIFARPSDKSVEKLKTKIREIFSKGLHQSPNRLLLELNPVITGWAMYFRIGISYRTFHTIDNFIWYRTWRYAKRRHPKKGGSWLKQKYYTQVQGNNWVFYDNETGFKIRRLSKIGIKRHIKVKVDASPDDPRLIPYWNARRKEPNGSTNLQDRLWRKQHGRCPLCKRWLQGSEQLHIHHINSDRNDNQLHNLQLVHETCHHQITIASRRQLMVA